MKSNRAVGPIKSLSRMPITPLTAEHLSSLEAFERWQRESPHANVSTQAEESATDSSRGQSLKN
jgi:hypothetical protein